MENGRQDGSCDFRRAPDGVATVTSALHHFSLRYRNGYVRIRSTQRAGSHGEIRLYERQAARLFETLRRHAGKPRSYEAWAYDPYPAGEQFALVRLDGEPGVDAGKLLVSVCAPPSLGELVLGAPSQENVQFAALLSLERMVAALHMINVPTETDRVQAAHRARQIRAMNPEAAVPATGYCCRCNADVTRALLRTQAIATACPYCWASWLD